MIEIDGSRGEGGGQIVRSSLALSMVTGQPVTLNRIRARRRKTGLLKQHLTGVQLATQIASARVTGAELGASRLVFEPQEVRAGTYHVSIGSAGSTSLVLQTVLPALVLADGPSVVVIEGGTHNPAAPPYDFLRGSYLPLLKRMGAEVRLTLERHGFYPRGGGRIRAEISPGSFARLDLTDRGPLEWRRAISTVADLPQHVARRELDTLAGRLDLSDRDVEAEVLPPGRGPGNVCRVELQHEHATLVFTEYGKKGLPAELVAARLADQVQRFEAAHVAVDEHLADQLLLPMALGAGGRFTTLRPSEHTRTQLDVIGAFLEVDAELVELGEDRWRVEVGDG